MRILPLLLASAVLPVAYARTPVHTRTAMVVAQEPLATDVGVTVLKSGGNAVDAAVAVGFALAVTHPYAGNLGGGGFMLVRLADGRSTFIDFRERAPAKASHDMYLDSAGKPTRDSLEGWKASGVPGSVRGFELAHAKYGRRPWRQLLNPAIRLAAQGFPVSYSLMQSLKTAKLLGEFPESRRIFLKGGAYIRLERDSSPARIKPHTHENRSFRREGFLRRPHCSDSCRRDAEERRTHHARRSQELSGGGAQAA